jgi:hypothetical protein
MIDALDCLEGLFDGLWGLIEVLLDVIGDSIRGARRLWNETQPAVKSDSDKQ